MDFEFEKEFNNLMENTVKPNLENINFAPYDKSFHISPKEANMLEKSILEAANNIILTKDTGIPSPEDLEKIPEEIRRKEYERQKMFVENISSRFRNTSNRVDVKLNDRFVLESDKIDTTKINEAKEQLRKANKYAIENIYEIEE